MSGTTVPLWKQELLKRRERNAKLTVKQENPPRPFVEASSHYNNSAIPNHLSNREAERKTDIPFRRHRVVEQNVSGFTEKGSSESREFISEDGVDGFRTDTRQQSEDKGCRLSSPFVNSRLDRPNESSTQARKRTGKYDKSGQIHSLTNGETMLGISRLDREYNGDNVNSFNSITIDNTEKETSRLKSLVGVERGVDSEHIRPKDVKKMWKRQESKEELYPESQNTHPKKLSCGNHIEKTGSMEVNKKQTSSQEGNSFGNRYQGNSSIAVGNVPKAYKSPYAKKGWLRQTTVEAGKPSEKNCELHPPPQSNGLARIKKENNSFSVKDVLQEKVKNDHIPSVKSLLGLFGGRGATKVSRKHHDNLSRVNKTEKHTDGRHPVSPTSGASVHVAPNLTRHHSEPNLYSLPREDTRNALQISQSQNASSSQSSEVLADKPAALPTHHVSRGIEERMSRLRRASQSSMEEMEISVDNDRSATGDGLVVVKKDGKGEQMLSSSNYNSEPREIVADKNLLNKKKEESIIGGNSVCNHKEDSYIEKNSVEQLSKGEKSTSSGYVNDDNIIDEVSDRTNNSEHLKIHHHDSKPIESQEEQDKAPKQSFDKLLSVFGPRAGKKTTADVNDTKESKSVDKYLDKQSNYVVEGDQSGGGLRDQLVSTENSNGIMKNQQQNKMVIKIEESNNEVEKKAERKPRRSLLNVVDPLDVLQLTKDPILLKGKPVLPDLGLIKEPETGRKPTVEIIKSQPDNKAKIAQINRAWDLNHVQPSLPPSHVSHQTMPSNSSQQTAPEVQPPSKNIPVTSIDDIPVSSIDEVVESETRSNVPEINTDTPEVKLGNTTFYTGTLTCESVDHDGETEEEFIPVSSIDDDSSLLPPPEIVFDKKPEKVKSCFTNDGIEKRGNVSFFQHVFIHDYQSETAATADWDFENGMAFSSYTPVAVRQYVEVDVPAKNLAPSVPPVDHTTPPEDPRNDEPTIIYNEEDSMGFTESSDSTAGALLF